MGRVLWVLMARIIYILFVSEVMHITNLFDK